MCLFPQASAGCGHAATGWHSMSWELHNIRDAICLQLCFVASKENRLLDVKALSKSIPVDLISAVQKMSQELLVYTLLLHFK